MTNKLCSLSKGMVLEHYIALGGAGLNGSWTKTKAFSPFVEDGRDEKKKSRLLAQTLPDEAPPVGNILTKGSVNE